MRFMTEAQLRQEMSEVWRRVDVEAERIAEREAYPEFNPTQRGNEMTIFCKDNDGFEDSLTRGMLYRVLQWGQGSAQVLDDAGRVRWFGLSKFTLIS